MGDRSRDWFKRADRNLELAEASRAEERHEWACFAAQQAAELAAKAIDVSLNVGMASAQIAAGHGTAAGKPRKCGVERPHDSAGQRIGQFPSPRLVTHRKALHLSRGQEACGHSVARLLAELPEPASPDLVDRGRVLDNFYVPTRSPNGHPEGPPFEHYGSLQSKEAIEHARAIIEFVRSHMAFQ